MSPHRSVLRTLAVAIVLLPFAVAGPAAAAPASPLHRAAQAKTSESTSTITLITGDSVSLVRQADGKQSAFVKPGAGREHIAFTAREVDGHVRVIPADAGPLLAAGRLDPRLFDITKLAEFAYDDSKTDSMPLIVTGGSGVASLAATGARITRQLPSVGGVALAESKKDATAFWQSLTVTKGFAAAGATKVWLNGRSKVLDADSNAQIGVPAARAAGLDGRGVTVGVLDTGIDATHPDLKDVVGETKDFTGSADGVTDDVGHGTHVSSIIAGTGAVNPAYGGAAPRATIVMGKVCGSIFCDDDAILAGMEWIAGKAKIVNMSLGSDQGTNDDLASQAVNRLTASTGTLFVASAGNSASAYQIAAPAAADSALAVASVGRTDMLSGFSSKGPRTGDNAVKPDIAAPGENIVAARAAGTTLGTPVGDDYVSASGTSMAAPHVTGVAALVAQAHPDWTADRIKAALMNSSAQPQNYSVFEAGAGRVDAARAVSQSVFAEGSVGFGFLTWPHTGGTQSKVVTYHNDGSAPVTLDLALSGSAGAFSLSTKTLTVPANGTAQANVVLDLAKLPTTGGTVSARLIATASGVAVTTAIGAVAEPESFNVRITLLDRNGAPASNDFFQSVSLSSFSSSGTDLSPRITDGVATVRVPKGDYAVDSETVTPGEKAPSTTLQIMSKLSVTQDTELTLDARRGVRAQITVADQPAAEPRTLAGDFGLKFGDRSFGSLVLVSGDEQLFAVPTTAAAGTELDFGMSAVLGSPARETKPYQYYLTQVAPAGTIPANLSFKQRTADQARHDVDFRGQGKPTDALFGRGPTYLPTQGFSFAPFVPVSMPVKRTDYLSPQADWVSVIAFQRPAGQPATAPYGFVWDVTGKPVVGKAVPETWNAAVVGPSLALAPNFGAQVVRFGGDNLSVSVPLFSPAAPNQGNNAGFQTITSTGDTTLALEGTDPVGSGLPGIGGFAGLPAQNSRYVLTTTATRTDAVPWSDLSTKVEAKWTFSSSEADDLLPLMSFRTTGPFDGLNKAKSGLALLNVDVFRQPQSAVTTAKVRNVTLEYSSDDGATWTRAFAFGTGNSWHALVVNPESGFVSLRTTATDSAGDTHSTTAIRAYGIR